MIALRPAATRGATRSDSLERLHSFTSGDYYDPAHMGFGSLRVLDSERLAPEAASCAERRANMEILTWVIAGAGLRCAGAVESTLCVATLDGISAGSGIDQSLRNSGSEPLRTLQIWLQPTRVNATPRHGTRQFSDADLRGGLRLIASGDAGDDAWPLLADARIHAARLQDGEELVIRVAARRRAWLQVVRGALDVGTTLAASGDGVAISDEEHVIVRSRCDSEFVLIDVA